MLGLGLSLTTGGVITPYYVVVANAFRDRVEADGGTVESMSCLKKDLKVLNPVKPPAYTGLLNDYSGAAAAYSLRLLDNTYSGDAIVVRRASDNTTQAIGFVNNELDTTSLESFCSGTDGFVTTWYDQSGNGNDAAQASASSQPQIVSSGSTILENGKPTLEYVNSYFNFSSIVSTASIYVSSVLKQNAVNLWNVFLQGASSSNRIRFYSSGDIEWRIVSTTIAFTGATHNLFSTYQLSRDSSNLVEVHQNTSALSGGGSQIGIFDVDRIGVNQGTPPAASQAWEGTISEVVYYDIDQSSNRTGIETNINDFYSIY